MVTLLLVYLPAKLIHPKGISKVTIMHKFRQLRKTALALLAITTVLVSCKDPYYYDDREPEWLGASIYDYLEKKGDFKYFLRIVDTTGYAETLKRTGSKTVFVCPDSCFEYYFKHNEDGITCFEDFTLSDLKGIKEYAIVNDANLIELLSYDVGYVEGEVMRRPTALDPLDKLVKESPSQLPDFNPYYARFLNSGIWVLNDNTSPRLVQFFESQMKMKNITNEDFSILFNGQTREDGDAHLFDRKVVERDITCKNGYIHVLDGLLRPQPNMAEFIRDNGKLTVFNRLLDRYNAPYPNVSVTEQYRTLAGNESFADTIYVRRYFSKRSAGEIANSTDPQGEPVLDAELLLLDPNWNAYAYTNSGKSDMAVMFVPSDSAMNAYFSPSGTGSYLHERYQYWDSVPNDIAALFLNAHMKYSFLASLPSKMTEATNGLNGIKNEAGDYMYISKNDIESAKVTTNGVVYVTKKVYPPIEYASVMAPILVSENTKVFNYALKNLTFDIYLKSMETVYSQGYVPPYTFIVPTDEYLNHYVYIPSLPRANANKEMISIYYDDAVSKIACDRFSYDVNTGVLGANKGYEERFTQTDITHALLNEMMDYHIIVGEITPEQKYYITKGKCFVRIDMKDENNIDFLGGGNIEQNEMWSSSGDKFDGDYTARLNRKLTFSNGKTYFVDHPLQHSSRSILTTLKLYSDLSEFADCLNDAGLTVSVKNGYSVLGDGNISFLSDYHYSVYAPSNAAMARAYAAGLPSGDQIEAETDTDIKAAKKEKLANFIRYHFQDNSVFIEGEKIDNVRYESSDKNDVTGKFFSIQVTQDGQKISLVPAVSDVNGTEAYFRSPIVIDKTASETAGTPYNVMTRDYFFKGTDNKNVNASLNNYSARAVVHEIDDYLYVVKAPVVSRISTDFETTTSSAVGLIVTISDNGDGVAYDNHVITDRGVIWGWTPDLNVNNCEGKVSFTSTKDVGEIKGKLTYPAADVCASHGNVIYVRAYAESKWCTDMRTYLVERAHGEGDDHLVTYGSTVLGINTLTGKKAE